MEHDEHLELQDCMHPIVFPADMTRDIIHMNWAICHPDTAEFIKSTINKNNAYIQKKNWLPIKHRKVPTHAQVNPIVWSKCRKCDLTTQV